MMKKRWAAGLFIAAMVLPACGNKQFDARAINFATDICKICNMSIADEKYAGQVALANGDYEVFDDIGCLMTYYNGMNEADLGATFVKSYSGDDWVQVEKAIFVSGEMIATPMSYGVIAFETTEEAEAYIAKEHKGKIISFDEVKAMDWGAHA